MFISQVKNTIEDYQKQLPFDNKTLSAIEEYDSLSEEEKLKQSDPRTWPLARAWPNYKIGNFDSPRAASRFGSKLLDAMTMAIMMLQGSTITYYGDEIGMVDSQATAYPTPMQWDDTSNAGTNAENKIMKYNNYLKIKTLRLLKIQYFIILNFF